MRGFFFVLFSIEPFGGKVDAVHVKKQEKSMTLLENRTHAELLLR
jgi:hypothetical protein